MWFAFFATACKGLCLLRCVTVHPVCWRNCTGSSLKWALGLCPLSTSAACRATHSQKIRLLAAMLKAEYRSRSKSMRLPEHPCPQQQIVRVPGPYGHQRIHAQSTISLMFQDHTIPRAFMPKHIIVCVPRAYGVCTLKRPL